ncbi:pyridoxal phosphate-dependent transferase [[Clostridium] sordellii]|uniref:aminotransferase class I/II-fold pyridoxal phosphate-dependent enzyme n=1 Tax=Paraclostridium sordellii TaxID=1505 RepID=UPI0005DBB1C7|nr:aminotransferase class I/II-fold pyridoxal phosphate-dependent enzyme [Paeniclostridium sordellii]CEO10074.1 pyridoxal phosphate-dependent transferase [[Clostridium] sordellii] [Paeniclostridium sordellii]
MIKSMVAKHAIWPKEEDIIFSLSERAQRAENLYNKENVINATIGVLVDDNGKLVAFNSVYDEYKNLENTLIAPYAQIAGQKNYIESVKKACFKNHMPEGYIKVVASPGGTGSIKMAIFNYTNEKESILTPDWYWGPYKVISEEINRKIVNYDFFDENGNFNFKSFKNQFINLSEKQERIFTIFNTPAHNPTGYTISNKEWDDILNLCKETSNEKKIILFIDIAYIDFSGSEGNDTREFFEKFSNLPENIIVIVGYSMSKGYTAYGMRSGACICISSNKEIADEFYYSCSHSARANWSNCNRGAMELLSTIVDNDKKLKAYELERDSYKDLLKERAKAFVEEANNINLNILPYRDGFFISIPCENPIEVCEKAIESNLFMIPLKMGIRFAVCAVNKEKCKKAPKIIKEAIEFVNMQDKINLK